MKEIKLVLFGIVASMVLYACNSSGWTGDKVKVTMPGIEIPIEDYNSKISIIPFPGLENSNRNGDSMTFLVINPSNQSYVFPFDYGIKIFQKKGANWEAVENHFSYGGEELQFILAPQKESPTGMLIGLVPYIPDLQELTNIRVVVVGHIEDDPNQLVGAYIDVALKP